MINKTTRTGFLSRGSAVIAILVLISFNAAGQEATCTQGSAAPFVHAEGLAELVGNVVLTCTGGAGTVVLNLFITLSTNITNRLDVNGNPTNITVTVNSGGNVPQTVTPTLLGSSTLAVNGIKYTAGPPTTITIAGIYADVGSPPSGKITTVTAQVAASGVQLQPGSPGGLFVGIPGSTLLDSTNNNGIPCAGSPLPSNPNFGFTDLINAGTAASTIRVTEASPSAFLPKAAPADTGTRILVNLSGYGNNTQVFVPSAIVGNTGTIPTSAGGYLTTISGGTYTPGQNQLLLFLVDGADVNGAGGVISNSAPPIVFSFSGVSPVTLTNGTGYVVYEVADGNPFKDEWAQIPVFVGVPQTSCPSTAVPNISAMVAPVSTVAVATLTDPIPRFLATPPGLDCAEIGDCSAAYFPALVINPTSVTLNGTAFGGIQNSFFQVGNGGGGVLPFTLSIAYQSGSNWLSETPASGTNSTTVNLTANPGALAQGTYQATVTVNAGVWGSQNVPITFNVGPPGPIVAVNPTSITLNGSSGGGPQQGTFAVSNSGVGTFNFAVLVSTQSGGTWLTANPTTGANSGTVTLTANPVGLMQGTYQGTVTVNGGLAGTLTIPVTFNVSAPVPILSLSPTSVTLNGVSLGAAQQGSFLLSNAGGGSLSFTASVTYQSGTNWLTASPATGTNTSSATINLTANPSALTPGTYMATVTVNGGSAGTSTVAVTFNVASAGPVIQSVVNSANLQAGAITAGSYATIFGLNLAGTNVQVTFNSALATVVFDGATQINVLVPVLGSSVTQASVVATINGQVSNTFTVNLTQNAPAVFNPGILNQDNSVNLATQPATPGTFIQIFLTGLATPVTSAVTVTIGTQTGLIPSYAGISSISGLEQVNVQIPVGLTFTGNSAPLSICVAGSCSIPVNLYLN